MDGTRFDDLARRIATRSSRRDVARGLLGAAVVAVAGGAGLRGNGSRAEEGLATPELTVEPIDPTVEIAPTETSVEFTATATSTATASPTATATASATPTPAGPGLQATPRVALSPVAGKPGATVNVAISGFAPNDAIQLRWYTGSSFVSVGAFTASRTGTGSFAFTVPATTSGSHRVRAQGASLRADAYFEVQRSTRLAPTTGPRGTKVTVTLRGFRARKEHRILFYSFDTRTGTPLELARVTTSNTGSASTTITIPSNALFTKHRIEAIETGGTAYAGAYFTVPAPTSTATPTSTPTRTATPTRTPTPPGCTRLGQACSGGPQCCSGLVCAFVNGTFEERCCTPFNGTCSANSDCCSGFCDTGLRVCS